MIKFKKMVLPSIALVIISFSLFMNYKKSNIIDAKQKLFTSSTPQKIATEKPIIHKGINEVKSNIPYSIKSPTANIDDLKLVNMQSDEHTYKNKKIHISYSFYKGDNNKQLTIQQADTIENNPIADNSTEKIKLDDGTIASISDECNGKGFIHIIFSKDGKNYDVMGLNLDKERLINIANSLK